MNLNITGYVSENLGHINHVFDLVKYNEKTFYYYLHKLILEYIV